MGMLRVCTAAGCETKTLGLHCIEHEPSAVRDNLDEALHAAIVRLPYRAESSGEPLEPNT